MQSVRVELTNNFDLTKILRQCAYNRCLVFVQKRAAPSVEVCPICLEGGERMCTLDCDHTFHQSCLVKWFLEKTNCPLCRAPVHV